MIKEIRCPGCGTKTGLMVERRPDGNSTCKNCEWSGPYKDCFPDTEGKLLAHIAKLEAQNQKLVEALKFYRDFTIRTSWYGIIAPDTPLSRFVDGETKECNPAAEVLKELGFE